MGCCQVFLWLRSKEADFVFDLGKNLKLLEDKRKKLEYIKKDVEEQIEEAHQNNPEVKISHQLSGWRQRVEAIQQEIEAFEVQGAQEIQNKCLSNWCPKNCRSSYELGKNIAKMLKDVDELATEGKNFGNRDFIVSHKVVPRAIEMRQDEVVGLDLKFNEVWNCIEEEDVGIIGLYGMGGAGKTTLLKKINNELVKRGLGFDFVMWVVVSKEPNLNSIMDNIRKLVGIGDDFWNRSSNLDEKAAKIYGALKHKKFILLLDDIWDQLDLELVGVPHPNDTKSKVLFTTRLENVCAKMQVQKKFKEVAWWSEECGGLGTFNEELNKLFMDCTDLETKIMRFEFDLIDKWMWEEFLCKDMTMSVQDIRGHDHDNMELVKRISITDDWESQKSIDPTNVTTLVLLKEIQRQLEDIKYMKRLKVLELHVSGQEFGDIGGLTSLEYLYFHIIDGFPEAKFWINLQSLTNLKFLSIQYTNYGVIKEWEILLGVLSSLQQLRVFRLASMLISPLEERRILEELECLPNIEELWITIQSSDGLNKLWESTKLQSCLYYLSTIWFSEPEEPNEMRLLSLGSVSGLKKLQQIVLNGLNIIYPFMLEKCWLAKLRMVEINSCQVTHVTWLKYAPLLQRLKICECESMEEVIKEEEAIKDENVDSSLVFSSLVELILERLPILKSIHRAPLPFPSLKSIEIYACPKLERLPFDLNSAKDKLTLIRGRQNWWDNLKWDDPTAKQKFQSKFIG
ncbi:hypothetical protein K1719_021169 [Acacia pycnantha]|nr:hypothetical protein K1719_021169 [Acacia pycnantha]